MKFTLILGFDEKTKKKQMKFVFRRENFYAARSKNLAKFAKLCGNSSVGRAQPCQGWGRGFESRFPLNFFNIPCAGGEIGIHATLRG